MKKKLIIIVSMLFALSCFGLTACGGGDEATDTTYPDSPYLGEWITTDVSVGDKSGEMDEQFMLTVNIDGTGSLVGSNEGETSEFTWEPTEGGFKTDGDLKVTFKGDGDDAIHAKIFGVKLNFERVKDVVTE